MRRAPPRLLALLLLGLLLLTTCGDEEAAAGRRLEADAARSFATPLRRFLIGVHGDGWVLRARLEEGAFPYHEAEMPLDVRVWVPDATLIRGPDLETYVRPPAGPPTLPLPVGGRHTLHVVQDLWVRVRAKHRLPEPHAYVDVTLEPFRAGGVRHVIPGPLRVLLKGPYP